MTRFTKWLRRLFKAGPRQAVGEGEGTVDGHDPPCSSGAATSQRQGVDNTSKISETSEEGTTYKQVDEPPYIPECEVFEAGSPEAWDKFENCDRNCKKDFIPVKEFTKDHLPEGFRDEWTWNEMKKICAATVKVVTRYTSVNRPDTHPDSTAPYPYVKYKGSDRVTRTGTGLIIPYIKPSRIKHKKCPCPDCKSQKSGKAKKEWFSVIVLTAAHVVFNSSEVGKTVCELFDDDPESKDSVKLLYGVKEAERDLPRLRDPVWLWYKYESTGIVMPDNKQKPWHDLFAMECVSHDMELFKILEYVLDFTGYYDICQIPFIVSHPHGCSKMVGIGTNRGALFQLHQTHTRDTPYIIPVGTIVKFEMDLMMTRYPEFFEEYHIFRDWHRTTQPLYVYTPCDTSNIVTFRLKTVGNSDWAALPERSRCCSVDGGRDIPVDDLIFSPRDLVPIFKTKDDSCRFVYDYHTCLGSSGAWVPTRRDFGSLTRCHCGKISDGRLNGTGMYAAREMSFYL